RMIADATQHLLHLAAGSDQRPGMLRRHDILELDEAGAGDAVDGLAGGIGDEMEVKAPVRLGQRHGDSPGHDSVQENPVIPRQPRRAGFHPGPAGFPPPLSRAGSDCRPSPRMPGTTSLGSRSIPLIPGFPVADCRGFAGLSPEAWAPPASGLYLKANSGTSINPRVTCPHLPNLPIDSIICSRKKRGENGG